MRRVAVFLILILSAGICGNAQDVPRLQDAYFEAEYFLLSEDYADALPYYQGIYAAMPDNDNIAFRIGLCYLNIEGQKNLAVEYLEKASVNPTAKYREGLLRQTQAPYEALFFLGDAYRVNYMFDKARDAYTRYRSTLLPNDKDNLAFIDQQIAGCDNAQVIMANPVKFSVESMGNTLNDSRDNFFPVVARDGKSIAFMSSMKFYDAIMYSKLVKGEWTTPVNITPELQSDGDQYVSCLSLSSNMLFLSKDDNINSDIWVSKFNGEKWEPATKLRKEINTKYWETHAYISDDGTTLIFASDRPGGFGGLDLYISKLNAEGEWGTPVNAGPEINTHMNEDRPFLVDNGKKLYFSSQGHYNMGGYDIFTSELQSNGLWSTPENLGYPLNTPDDNIFFCPSDNGKEGYLSLTRENEGEGKEDLYRIRFR